MITILVDDCRFVFSEFTLKKNPDFIVTKIRYGSGDTDITIPEIIEIIDENTYRIDMSPEEFSKLAKYLRKHSYDNYEKFIELMLFQGGLEKSIDIIRGGNISDNERDKFESKIGFKPNTNEVQIDHSINTGRENGLKSIFEKKTEKLVRTDNMSDFVGSTFESVNKQSDTSNVSVDLMKMLESPSLRAKMNTFQKHNITDVPTAVSVSDNNPTILGGGFSNSVKDSDNNVLNSKSDTSQKIDSDFFNIIQKNNNMESYDIFQKPEKDNQSKNLRIFKSRKVEFVTTENN
jgi:hypothetical protein